MTRMVPPDPRPYRLDLHCHTAGSFDSRADPAAIARAALARGLTHLAITDHDTIEVALRLRDEAPPDLVVIVGCEVHTAAGDLVAVFLERPVPAGMPPADTIAAVHEQGGLVGIPHPFDRARRSILRNPAIAEQLRGADWVEVHNARVAREADNVQAAGLARQLGVPGVAVSDAHTAMEVGGAWTSLPVAPVTAVALRAALREALPGTAAAEDGPGPAGSDRGATGGLLAQLRDGLRRRR